MSEETVKRPYHAPRRAERARATRRRIRAAATERFLRDGYAATSMRAVAEAAGVAERTVYVAFPSKAALLSELVRVAVRGGDDETPVAAGERWRRVLAAPDAELLQRFATHAEAILHRSARILVVAEAAAGADPELRALRERGQAAQRALYRELAGELRRRGRLAPPPAEAADSVFALVTESLYLRLRDDCGWSRRRYARWLEAMLRAGLVRG